MLGSSFYYTKDLLWLRRRRPTVSIRPFGVWAYRLVETVRCIRAVLFSAYLRPSLLAEVETVRYIRVVLSGLYQP